MASRDIRSAEIRADIRNTEDEFAAIMQGLIDGQCGKCSTICKEFQSLGVKDLARHVNSRPEIRAGNVDEDVPPCIQMRDALCGPSTSRAATPHASSGPLFPAYFPPDNSNTTLSGDCSSDDSSSSGGNSSSGSSSSSIIIISDSSSSSNSHNIGERAAKGVTGIEETNLPPPIPALYPRPDLPAHQATSICTSVTAAFLSGVLGIAKDPGPSAVARLSDRDCDTSRSAAVLGQANRTVIVSDGAAVLLNNPGAPGPKRGLPWGFALPSITPPQNTAAGKSAPRDVLHVGSSQLRPPPPAVANSSFSPTPSGPQAAAIAVRRSEGQAPHAAAAQDLCAALELCTWQVNSPVGQPATAARGDPGHAFADKADLDCGDRHQVYSERRAVDLVHTASIGGMAMSKFAVGGALNPAKTAVPSGQPLASAAGAPYLPDQHMPTFLSEQSPRYADAADLSTCSSNPNSSCPAPHGAHATEPLDSMVETKPMVRITSADNSLQQKIVAASKEYVVPEKKQDRAPTAESSSVSSTSSGPAVMGSRPTGGGAADTTEDDTAANDQPALAASTSRSSRLDRLERGQLQQGKSLQELKSLVQQLVTLHTLQPVRLGARHPKPKSPGGSLSSSDDLASHEVPDRLPLLPSMSEKEQNQLLAQTVSPGNTPPRPRSKSSAPAPSSPKGHVKFAERVAHQGLSSADVLVPTPPSSSAPSSQHKQVMDDDDDEPNDILFLMSTREQQCTIM